MKLPETVTLKIPVKAEYVSTARLTASGIASKIGFDFDAIEDIKVSISEVLGKIIEKQPEAEEIAILFENISDGLTIKFLLSDNTVSDIFDGDEDSLSLAIVNSLMDEIDMQKNGQNILTMVKKLGKAV
ncbi:MAG: anti-sigma regulatory factor [Clostridiaceae bacterium]|nr:anti-sigma regulatory factor [Clostridiaceae bacterium]